MLMNQKSPGRSRGNASSPDVEREALGVSSSQVLSQMFQGVAAGLPPSMSTEMFQTSIQVIRTEISSPVMAVESSGKLV